MTTVNKDEATQLLEAIYSLTDNEVNVLACIPENDSASAVAIASDFHILPGELSGILEKFLAIHFIEPPSEPPIKNDITPVIRIMLSETGRRAQALTKVIRRTQDPVISLTSQALAGKLNL